MISYNILFDDIILDDINYAINLAHYQFIKVREWWQTTDCRPGVSPRVQFSSCTCSVCLRACNTGPMFNIVSVIVDKYHALYLIARNMSLYNICFSPPCTSGNSSMRIYSTFIITFLFALRKISSVALMSRSNQ